MCGKHALTSTNACIGDTSDCIPDDVTGNRGRIQLLVASDFFWNGIQYGGIQLCPMVYRTEQTAGLNIAFLTEALLDESLCIDVCFNGWTGDNCSLKSENVQSRSIINLNASTFQNANVTDNTTFEKVGTYTTIFNLQDSYDTCNSEKELQHMGIFAASNWTPSGHGIFVQNMIVRVDIITDNNASKIHPVVYPYTERTPKVLLCLDGYTYNKDSTDCVLIAEALGAGTGETDETSEDGETQTSEDGENKPKTPENYDATQHMLTGVNDDNVYTFRCKNDGYAFMSEFDVRCIECKPGYNNGIDTETGVCIKCKTGEFFNEITERCIDAIALSKLDMVYGRNRTRNSYSGQDSVTNQCWTKTDANAYRSCVLNRISLLHKQINSNDQ